MLYAIYAKRDPESSYAIQENFVSSKITLVRVNVESKEQIYAALNMVFNLLASKEFEPDLDKELRQQKLELLGSLIYRVRMACGNTDRRVWYNSAGALIKSGFPPEELEQIIWA